MSEAKNLDLDHIKKKLRNYGFIRTCEVDSFSVTLPENRKCTAYRLETGMLILDSVNKTYEYEGVNSDLMETVMQEVGYRRFEKLLNTRPK